MKKHVKVKYINSSPFPVATKSGAVIVDERCACGGLRSDHEDTLYSFGHGQLDNTGCAQFTWVASIEAPVLSLRKIGINGGALCPSPEDCDQPEPEADEPLRIIREIVAKWDAMEQDDATVEPSLHYAVSEDRSAGRRSVNITIGLTALGETVERGGDAGRKYYLLAKADEDGEDRFPTIESAQDYLDADDSPLPAPDGCGHDHDCCGCIILRPAVVIAYHDADYTYIIGQRWLRNV